MKIRTYTELSQLKTFEERYQYVYLGGTVGRETFGSKRCMNPVTVDDIIDRTPFLLDPEYLICVSFATHEAITFSEKDIQFGPIERKPNDTCPWRK